mgnify:CR=1 FL=1
MAWWTNPNIQLKQKNRFIMSIGEFLIPTVVSVDKPSVSIESKEYTMINHVYRYPGIAKWQPITVTFVDGSGNSNQKTAGFGVKGRTTVQEGAVTSVFATGEGVDIPIPGIDSLDAAQMLYKILYNSGYKSTKSVSGATAKNKFINSSFGGSVRIEQIEPDGKTVSEGWKLHNPIVTDIKWGSLSYADDSAVEYTITIAYDWAEFYIGEQGKGIGVSKGNYSVSKEDSLRKKTIEEIKNEKLFNIGRTQEDLERLRVQEEQREEARKKFTAALVNAAEEDN